MSMPRILAAITAASIALGTFSLGATVPAAAAMGRHHLHHALACKKHWVRLSRDNWIWTCGHRHHHRMTMTAPMGAAPRTHTMGGGGGGMKY